MSEIEVCGHDSEGKIGRKWENSGRIEGASSGENELLISE